MSKYLIAVYVPPDEEPDWKEVTLEEFQQAERNAGFRNKGGGPTATAGFIGRGIMGNVLYEPRTRKLDEIEADLHRHARRSDPPVFQDYGDLLIRAVRQLGNERNAIKENDPDIYMESPVIIDPDVLELIRD